MADFASVLMRLWPNGDEKIHGLRAGMMASAPAVFGKHGITSPLLVAHLMAQISHECGAGHDVVEDLSYSAQRLPEVWPKHFNRINAPEFAHNPEKLGNFIYNPPQHVDLGNRAGSDDGFRFRGRGGAQTTGRAAYEHLSRLTGLDLLGNPDLINDPANFLDCAVADFVACGCLTFAKADDVVGVTKRLNGGTIGLAQREAWLRRWKDELGSTPIVLLEPTGTRPVAPLAAPRPSVPQSPKPAPAAAARPPAAPSITNPAPGSIGAFLASILGAIFKPKG